MMTITDSLKWRDDSCNLKFINPGAMSQHHYPCPGSSGCGSGELFGAKAVPAARTLIFLDFKQS
jgi:hypothetical protein